MFLLWDPEFFFCILKAIVPQMNSQEWYTGECVFLCQMYRMNSFVTLSQLISAMQSKRPRGKHEDETIFGSSSRLIMGCISVLSRVADCQSVWIRLPSWMYLKMLCLITHFTLMSVCTLGSLLTFPLWKEHHKLVSLCFSAWHFWHRRNEQFCAFQMFSLFITAKIKANVSETSDSYSLS